MQAIIPNETREQYISRCIPILIQQGMASSVDQAYDACNMYYAENAHTQEEINYTNIINNISFNGNSNR